MAHFLESTGRSGRYHMYEFGMENIFFILVEKCNMWVLQLYP